MKETSPNQPVQPETDELKALMRTVDLSKLPIASADDPDMLTWEDVRGGCVQPVPSVARQRE